MNKKSIRIKLKYLFIIEPSKQPSAASSLKDGYQILPPDVNRNEDSSDFETTVKAGDSDSEIFSKKNLIDQGIIGKRYHFATVKKMLHTPTNTLIAVKVNDKNMQ